MKAYATALAVLALLLSVILSGWINRAQAEARPDPRPPSLSNFQGFQVDKKNPFKQVDSSFRRIPPSTSNPTQNKCKPPLDD
ncbi:uncharacterized protein LOC112536939 [Ricinus communis]|uniref:uncharacterized protein LOC112536939 n=1 Tax=Ricinus communis TaxID=3988 RepID=UPI00201B0ECD|nr:uncharacterized protein LOC112536939 [Ricinus communis]